MSTHWPSERISPAGLVEFVMATVALGVGHLALQRAGSSYLAPSTSGWFVVGLVALVACGYALFRIVRRREYPWIIAFAAFAMPFYEPSQAPYGVADRLVFGVRDLALLAVVILFLTRAVRTGDELERRVQLEGLAWSYPVVLLALIGYALVEDVLPPLRGVWVASAMLASWAVAWAYASCRYQR